MIDYTDNAKKMLLEKINFSNQRKNVRIYLDGIGWAGPTFNITLDEVKENDLTVNVKGINFIVDKSLKETFKSFKIDYINDWKGQRFVVNTKLSKSRC